MTKFETIYYKYRKLMFKVAFEILGNVQEAEDAVQDALFRISENLDKISEADSPRTRNFCVIIVRNVSFNKLRKTAPAELGEDISAGEDVEETVFSNIGVYALERALKRLAANYRDILFLTVYEEMPLREAADFLGITYENAKSRVRRARKKLSEILKEDGYEQ